MYSKRHILPVFLCILCFSGLAFAQARTRTLVVQTEPRAMIWIDGVKRGVTDEFGKLEIKPVLPTAKLIKVRANGFREAGRPILAGQAAVRIPLTKTTDAAELAFQEAERILSDDLEMAVTLYRKAIKLNPRYAEAYVALARALTGSDNDAALGLIQQARRIRPVYPEASTVEGRIHRSENDIDKAIESFDRAIREGKGFEPEAHTGLGLIFKEEAEGAGAAGDLDDEKEYYEEAVKSFEKAIDQLSATEPVLYILLGEVYEKMENRQRAIAVYERFLRDFPVSDERSAVQSFIVQLKKEMNANR